MLALLVVSSGATGCTLKDAVPGEAGGGSTGGSGTAGQGGDGAGGAPGSSSMASGGQGASSSSASGSGGGGPCVPAQVSTRWDHTCVRMEDGDVWCWGDNDSGESGTGNELSPQKLPQPVGGLPAALHVGAGKSHSCALATDGKVWCWGDNQFGQVGDGTTNSPVLVPTQVTLGAAAKELAIGYDHACALRDDDTLWCWGRNDHGQLGDGSQTPWKPPVQVATLGTQAKSVSLGNLHTCVLKTDSSVWCWGNNEDGQLGDLALLSPQLAPVQVIALGNAVDLLAAGGYHNCALERDGTLRCWGKDTSGQIGDGSQNSSVPEPVTQVSAFGMNAAEVWAGSLNTCVKRTDGSLWCFGYNVDGQVGSDSFVSPQPTPVAVKNLGTNLVDVSVGYHSCAIEAGGKLSCWGRNDHGQLGDNSIGDEPVPQVVSLPCL